MLIKDILREAQYDATLLNQALANYETTPWQVSKYSGKIHRHIPPEQVSEFKKVIEIAKQKLLKLIDSSPDMKKDWRIFKQWYDANESEMPRFVATSAPGLVVDKGKGAPVKITQNGIEVSTNLRHLIYWRFHIMGTEKYINDAANGEGVPPPTFRDAVSKLAHFLKN